MTREEKAIREFQDILDELHDEIEIEITEELKDAYGLAIKALGYKPEIGHWIKVDTNMYTCSNCSNCFSLIPEDNHISQFKYCPNCGRRMQKSGGKE